MTRRERLAWVGLLGLAVLTRLWGLGDRPPHHDEAVHGHFAALVAGPGVYRYDPTYHGPLLFYITGALFALGGESLVTLRLYPVATGIGLVALPLLLRRRLGARAAWWTGVVTAVSPVFLYYGRFARNDVPVSLFTGIALAGVLLVRLRGWRPLPWVGVAAALHLVSKETFYVTVPLLAAAAGGVALRRGIPASVTGTLAWLDRHRLGVVTAVLWFVAVTLTGYTFFFTNPGDALFPVKAVRYWYEQHAIQRVGGPWFYHLPRLGLYEFLPLLAAAIWVGRRWRRLRDWELFCALWAMGGFAMYAYLGEKVPWLLVHQVLPLLPLAGSQLARTFSGRGRAWSRSLAVLGLAGTVWSAWNVAYRTPTLTPGQERAELLVFVQTTPAMGDIAALGVALQEQRPGEVVAAVSGEAAWPLSWQWRRVRVLWTLPGEELRPPLVICDPHQAPEVQDRLGSAYSQRSLPLRGWWVEEWSRAGPLTVAAWFVTRRPWSALGATDVVLLEATAKGDGGESP